MGKLTERPENELDAMAGRIADALNGMVSRLPIKPEDVDMRIMAELCWAIGVTPTITLKHRAALTEARDG